MRRAGAVPAAATSKLSESSAPQPVRAKSKVSNKLLLRRLAMPSAKVLGMYSVVPKPVLAA